MKTATLIRDGLDQFTGWAALYKIDPPMKVEGGETTYVVVSATTTAFGLNETYIFASDENGEITNWRELNGSYQGGQSHTRALEGAGYKAVVP